MKLQWLGRGSLKEAARRLLHPRLPIRWHLILLALAVLVPLLGFSIFAVVRLSNHQRTTIERSLAETARALGTGLDAEMHGTITALNSLAGSERLGHDDLAGFRAEARRAIAMQPGWLAVLVHTPDGREIMNTLGSRVGAAGVPKSPSVDSPVVGDLTRGVVGQALAFPVRVLVLREGAVRYMVTAMLTPASLSEMLVRHNLPVEAVGAVIDANGTIVARSREAGRYVGQPATGDFWTRVQHAAVGVYRARSIDGQDAYGAFMRAPFSRWVVAVALPASAVDGPLRRSLATMTAAGLALLVLSVSAAWGVGHVVASPIGAAAQAADALARGQSVPLPLSSVAEVNHLSAALKDAGDRLRQREQGLQLLADGAGDLLRASTAREVTDAVFARLATDLGLDAYFNYLLGDDHSALYLHSYAGVSAQTALTIARMEIGQGVCGAVAASLSAIVVEDAQRSQDPRTELVRSMGLTAYVCFPLLVDTHLIGTLCFGSRRRSAFDGHELDLLRAIANHAAVALERSRLLERLGEAMRRRERAQAEAESANRAKDEFLAMLGHELRNPLGAITSAMAVLDRIGKQEDMAVRTRDIVKRQAHHLARLMDDLLDVARLTTGKVLLAHEPIDLTAAVERCLTVARSAGRLHHHSVDVRMETAWVSADVTRLDQVIGNLLTNALKYTPAGGRILVEVCVEDTNAVLRVRDDGMGIAPDFLPHVFDPFRQGERGLDRSEGGMGIGLTLVRRLVEQHGGRVEARSDGVGRGSEFVVYLPRLTAPAQVPAAAARVELSARTRRILIVEDNDDARESVRALLELEGHRVEAAPDAYTALSLVPQIRPDVALIDIGLPGMDGYELARRLRASGPPPSHLIAVTGYGQEQDRRAAIDAGFDRHLVKPVDPDDLAHILAELDQ